jgi:hypothetical protein
MGDSPGDLCVTHPSADPSQLEPAEFRIEALVLLPRLLKDR